MWYIIYILNDYIRLISKHIRNLANTVHHSEQSKKKKKKNIIYNNTEEIYNICTR